MEEVLMEAGLSKNEAKIYAKLSEIGMTTAYRLSKEANVYKTNTYDVLKKIEEKGLVSKQTVDGKIVYEASDPSFLLDLLNSKRDKIDSIIPRIRLLQKSTKAEASLNTYKGADAVINVLYQFLEYNDPILVYGAPKTAYELLKHRLGKFHETRLSKKIKMYHIYNFEAMERIRQIAKMPYTPVRHLPELYDTQVSTFICGDLIVFTIWNPPIKIIQIKDKEMAEAYKKYFQILWGKAKAI